MRQTVGFGFDFYYAFFKCAITDNGLPFDLVALFPKPTGILTMCITTMNLSRAVYQAFDCATLLNTDHITSSDS